MLAEGRVAIAVGVLLEVLEVQELERHADATQLGVDPARVRQRALLAGRFLRTVELLLELVVAEVLDGLPAQPLGFGPHHH